MFVEKGFQRHRRDRVELEVVQRIGQRYVTLQLDQHAAGIGGELQPGADGWTTRSTIAGAMPAAAPFPAFAANGARDEVYLSDPMARQLLVVDAAQPQVKQRVALGFTPSYLAWLGIAR